MRIGFSLGTVLVALAIGGAIGCASGDGNTSKPNAAVAEYARCLAEPTSDLHVLAGSPTYEQAVAELEAEIASGEATLKEIEAALELFCRG